MSPAWRQLLPMLPALTLPAAADISVPPLGTGVIFFTASPPAAHWATASIPGTPADIQSVPALDAAVQAVIASDVTNALPTTTTRPPAESALAQWNASSQALQTCPADNAFTVLQVALRNETARAAASLQVSYFLGTSPGSAQGEGAYALDDFVATPGITPPRLAIARVSGLKVELAWPLEPAGYALQFTPDLAAPRGQAVSETDTPSGGFHRVSVDVSPATRLFRLERLRQ